MKLRFLFPILCTLLLATCAPDNIEETPEGPGATLGPATESPAVLASLPAPTAVAATSEPGPAESPAPVATSTPVMAATSLATGSEAPVFSPAELKYQLLAQFPDLFFCDPDSYPVARGDELDLARQRLPEIQADAAEFQAILEHNGLAGVTEFDDGQVLLLVYREHKKLAAIQFQPSGAAYQFALLTGQEGGQGELVSGMVDTAGQLSNLERQPTLATCPICLSTGTRIETPLGPIAVEALRLGDVVWTMDRLGQRMAAPVVQLSRSNVPAGFWLVHLVLQDGRELWASPGHPTAGGRALGDLKPGDPLDGSWLVSSEPVRYGQAATYDVLPAGETGRYWANGILLGSTLKFP